MAEAFSDDRIQIFQDWIDGKLHHYPLGYDADKNARIIVGGFLATITARDKRIEELTKQAELKDSLAEGVMTLAEVHEQLEDAKAVIERLRGALREADELLQRHDAGQLHNDHYRGHVLQEDTVAFFKHQVLDAGKPHEDNRPIMPGSKLCGCGEIIHQEVMEYRLRCAGCNTVYRRSSTEGGTIIDAGKE